MPSLQHQSLLQYAVCVAKECGWRSISSYHLQQLSLYRSIIPDALLEKEVSWTSSSGKKHKRIRYIRLEVVKTCDANTAYESLPNIEMIIIYTKDYDKLTLMECYKKLKEMFI